MKVKTKSFEKELDHDYQQFMESLIWMVVKMDEKAQPAREGSDSSRAVVRGRSNGPIN